MPHTPSYILFLCPDHVKVHVNVGSQARILFLFVLAIRVLAKK